MIEEENIGLTFSDEDFERRYSSEEAPGAAAPSSPPAASPTPPAAQTGRSRNRFMRTLLRRRLAASGRT
jgi:hypothetical protein